MSATMATAEGTEKYAARFPEAAAGHFRRARGLTVSSIGIGTYLGHWDDRTDKSYVDAITRFVESGGNVIDTAANYRFQRSERSIGEALGQLGEKGFGREELVICTKGGYLPFDGAPPATDVKTYFEENFVSRGVADLADLVGGSHCMAPGYLQDQLDQSLRNMDLAAVDIYYLHNPESQLAEVDRYTFEARLAEAFETLENKRADGQLGFYGVATWNGFRVSPQDAGYHSLEKMVNIASRVGGDDHGFRFIQLPFNLAMPEAYLFGNQAVNGGVYPVLQAAADLGVATMISGSILQGKLASGLPENIRRIFGDLDTDAQTSLQFVRSTPHVTTALIGMSSPGHVSENMRLAGVPPAGEEEFQELFTGQV